MGFYILGTVNMHSFWSVTDEYIKLLRPFLFWQLCVLSYIFSSFKKCPKQFFPKWLQLVTEPLAFADWTVITFSAQPSDTVQEIGLSCQISALKIPGKKLMIENQAIYREFSPFTFFQENVDPSDTRSLWKFNPEFLETVTSSIFWCVQICLGNNSAMSIHAHCTSRQAICSSIVSSNLVARQLWSVQRNEKIGRKTCRYL